RHWTYEQGASMQKTAGMSALDLETGLPSIEEARKRLRAALNAAKSRRDCVMKVIHGYGSSGVGGRLRPAIRQSLRLRAKEGVIEGAIHGENWTIFDERTRALLERYPVLKRDPDLEKSNEGIP